MVSKNFYFIFFNCPCVEYKSNIKETTAIILRLNPANLNVYCHFYTLKTSAPLVL